MPSLAQVSNNNEDGVYRVDSHSQKAFRPGELIVKFKSEGAVRKMAPGRFKTSAVSAVDKVFAEIGVEEVEQLMPLTGKLKANSPRKVKAYNGKDVEVKDMSKLYTVRLADAQQNVREVIDKLKQLDEVEFAEPNYIVYAQSTDDESTYASEPLYSQQWGIPEVGVDKLWNAPKITSKRPVIAIIDTGVDITHPDLAANIWTNTTEIDGVEGADDDANGFEDDIHGWDFLNHTGKIRDNNGHGTHCAGIAAAVGNNGIGIVGANPDALIMPIVVMQSDGTGDVATIIKGIDYAVANGADIISMSLGSNAYSIAEEQALANAYITSIIVAAAGNQGHDINGHAGHHCYLCCPFFPAAYTFVLGVQASTESGDIASFSNFDCDGPYFSPYGEETLYNYELYAPGTNIMSTYPGGRYKVLNGTSMACPLVAGALSRLMQCKEINNKELLFGDLINSTTKGYGILDIYSAYQINDADRRPSLNFITCTIDDSTGDADGRVDAGETIDIYPVLRNAWGTANNIRISVSIAENEDPEIVQIIDGDVDFGTTLSSYGKAASANPLRIKINDKCNDGRHIRLALGATCDNITEEIELEIMLVAENGVEIGGMITKDTTLPEGTYIVTRPLAVPAGVTLTIEPGAVLKFKDGTGLSVQYSTILRSVEPTSEGAYACTLEEIDRENSGRLIMAGTPEKRIILTKADNEVGNWSLNFGSNKVGSISKIEHYETGAITDIYDIDDLEHDVYSYVVVSYNNLYRSISGGFFNNSCFTYNENVNFEQTFIEKSNLCDNILRGLVGTYSRYSNYGNNILTNLGYEASTTYENFISGNLIPSYVSGGAFVSLYNESSTPRVLKTDTPSYFGSSKESKVRESVWDIENNFGHAYFDLSNMLTRPVAEAHGIVWKVVVNGKDAQDEFDELPPLGVGKHKFEIYFSRPMNKAVTPTVAMGVRPPYTSVSIAEDGSWNEAGDIYTAYLTITGKSQFDGLNRIRVYGAQDDEFFEIPEEKYRFNVMVQKAGSMSTGLMAESGLGKVKLTWETDEESFADLMGYNVFRFEDPKDDSNEEMRDMWDEEGHWYQEKGHWDEYGEWVKFIAQDTIMINPSLIEAYETEFIDYDVTPGTTYYYLVREIGTDLQQHDVSNVVSAVPQTSTLGDANGSGDVDVADVITTVNYAAGQDPKPFIFEAADMNADTSIDILDVIGIIKKIVNPQEQAQTMAEATAEYTIEDGVVYVESPVALAGVQVRLLMAEKHDITTAEDMKHMESTSAWLSDNDYIFLGYNMVGKTLEPGKHAILSIGDAQLADIRLSDASGHNVKAESSTVTKIDHMGSNVMNINGIYSLSGVRISGDVNKELPKGVYIINGKKVVK